MKRKSYLNFLLKTPKKDDEKPIQMDTDNRKEKSELTNRYNNINRRNNKLLYIKDTKENKTNEHKNMDDYNNNDKKYNTMNNEEDLKKEENLNENCNKNYRYIKTNIYKNANLPNYFNSNSTKNMHKKNIEFNNNIKDNLESNYSKKISQKDNEYKGSDKKNDNIKINTRNINNIEENLNIGELISQKNNNPLSYIIYKNTNINQSKINPKLLNNNYKKSSNEPNKAIRRYKSESNLNFKILPKYLEIFNDCNLFNSSLLILSNIFYINNYIKEKSNGNKLKECYKTNKPCLTTILYNINKYFYYFNIDNNNDDQFLSSLYNYYISWYSKEYFKENNPNNVLLNNNNLETIIKNIYEKINDEFTKINPPSKKVPKYERKELNKYLLEFWINHNSIISDYFMGTNQIEILCSNCNTKTYEYEPFSYIIFKKSENINNYANFYSCLNNFYSERNTKYSFCKSCGKNVLKVKFSICFSP